MALHYRSSFQELLMKIISVKFLHLYGYEEYLVRKNNEVIHGLANLHLPKSSFRSGRTEKNYNFWRIYAMKRVAAGAHLPIPRLHEAAKHPEDRA